MVVRSLLTLTREALDVWLQEEPFQKQGLSSD